MYFVGVELDCYIQGRRNEAQAAASCRLELMSISTELVVKCNEDDFPSGPKSQVPGGILV